MKKGKSVLIKAVALTLISLPAFMFAEKKVRYFSPNNDGIQDSFEIPLKISDKRYITAWSLVIENENGKAIRTIGNKVALPSSLTFKQFFKQLFAVKTGVAIPSSVTWNGAMDNGETAPDGQYFYYFTATDDNGNTGTTEKFPVIIDTVSPFVMVSQPSDKIFGEGVKSEFRISQTGSPEDSWVGRFRNASGETVRTILWENSQPENFRWDGKDDQGRFVPDGVYSYDISSTDRAGNVSEPASILNIIYSAEKPATNIVLSGSKYFSPKTESKNQNVKFEVTIPVPEKSSGNRLTSWSVKITDRNGKTYRTYDQNTDGDVPPSSIVFDGTGDDGKLIPQGIYNAVVSASYLNGYEPALIRSPEIVLDTTKPSAQISVSDKIFGAGAKTQVRISMLIDSTGKFASVPAWKGKIFDEENPDVSVKEYDFGEFPPESIEWNGFASDGKLASDAKYRFELRATDLAGNTGVMTSADSFELSTKDVKVLLSASDSAFSPNSDKVKDTISFTPVLKDADGIQTYLFTVKDSKGNVVKTLKDSSRLPANFVWDGKDESGIIVPDGNYSASLEIVSTNGSSASVTTSPFVLDTVYPSLEASVPWTAFSPDGDGNQDSVPVAISKSTKESLWKAEVLNSSNKAVKTFTWNNTKDKIEWDGSDNSGNKAPDGKYSIVISSEDEAGNAFSTRISGITLDSRETKAYITAENEGISPNGDKILDTQKFDIRTTVSDGILSWNFDVRSENGTSVRSWSDKDSKNLPASITWDGLDKSGNVAEGNFTGTLKIVYEKGNQVSAVSSQFVCTAIPPQLKVQTAPAYFSPDNDGTDDDLFIRLSGTTKAAFKNWSFVINDPRGNAFWQTKGTSSITERIIWDGLSNVQKDSNGMAERVQSAMDYPYRFTVTDTLGMTSVAEGVIPVDVLVIRDGDVLKMAVPSIIFRSDNADFRTKDEVSNGLDSEQAANNERVLKRIAEILNKFKDYRVTIVGHANRVTDNEAEETEDNPRQWGPALIPLSAKRAEFVKDYLTKSGVNASRLSTEGKGGTELVVDFHDKENNWKNRRVEFILEK